MHTHCPKIKIKIKTKEEKKKKNMGNACIYLTNTLGVCNSCLYLYASMDAAVCTNFMYTFGAKHDK